MVPKGENLLPIQRVEDGAHLFNCESEERVTTPKSRLIRGDPFVVPLDERLVHLLSGLEWPLAIAYNSLVSEVWIREEMVYSVCVMRHFRAKGVTSVNSPMWEEAAFELLPYLCLQRTWKDLFRWGKCRSLSEDFMRNLVAWLECFNLVTYLDEIWQASPGWISRYYQTFKRIPGPLPL